MATIETNRAKVVGRLEREGWFPRMDGGHDVYKHAEKRGRVMVPRHRELSIGVARKIAKQAGWM